MAWAVCEHDRSQSRDCFVSIARLLRSPTRAAARPESTAAQVGSLPVVRFLRGLCKPHRAQEIGPKALKGWEYSERQGSPEVVGGGCEAWGGGTGPLPSSEIPLPFLLAICCRTRQQVVCC